MRRILLPLLLIVALSWQTVAAQSEIVTEENYWLLIDETVDRLQANGNADGLISEWAAIDEVELESGTVVAVDPSYFVALLENDEVDSADQLAQFRALRQTQPQAFSSLDGANAISALGIITDQTEFQYVNMLPEWLTRLAELIERGIEYAMRLIELGVDSGIASLTGWVITGLAVLGLVAFLWYWLRGVGRQFSSDSEADDLDENGNLISADVAFDQAQALADQSDYRQAVRYLYLSTLLLLDERGLLRYDRSKTNREYLRSVHGSAFADTLLDVVNVFDRVWYGFQPIDAGTYQRYATAVRRLRES